MMEMGYPLDVMHHYEMEPQNAADFLDQVAGGKSNKMKGIGRISKSRRALLPQGALVLREIVRAMEPSQLVISAFGVREGYLYSLLDEADRAARSADSARPRNSPSYVRAPVTHAQELAAWSGEAFFRTFGLEETTGRGTLPPRSLPARRYRLAGASPNIAARNRSTSSPTPPSFGVDHPGRAFLALATMFRHEGVFEKRNLAGAEKVGWGPDTSSAHASWAPSSAWSTFCRLSMPGVIPTLKWRQTIDGKATIGGFPPKRVGALLGERPAGRLSHLARVLKRPYGAGCGRERLIEKTAQIGRSA